jgi:hypothetical protein
MYEVIFQRERLELKGMLEEEVSNMFDQFHGNRCLPKSFLSYFVALIMKVLFSFSLLVVEGFIG